VSDRAATIVIYVVLAIWAGNILAGIAHINGYVSSESINGIFMGTVGLAFVARSKKRNGGDEP
jgi:hypothetical protein